MPPKANCKIKRDYEKRAYKWRHMAEAFFGKKKGVLELSPSATKRPFGPHQAHSS